MVNGKKCLKSGAMTNLETKMTMRFYDPNLEEMFRKYANKHNFSMVTLFNLIIERFFNTQLVFNEDPGDNQDAIVEFINFIDWEKVKKVHNHIIITSPLTRNASLASVLAASVMTEIDRYLNTHEISEE